MLPQNDIWPPWAVLQLVTLTPNMDGQAEPMSLPPPLQFREDNSGEGFIISVKQLW